MRLVYQVTECTTLANGQVLLFPDVEVETYWTSLPNTVETIIKLYHAHGTSEQFHSEIKTDLDLERLPSGKFATNDLVLHLGVFSYNLLRVIGQLTPRDGLCAAEEEDPAAVHPHRDPEPRHPGLPPGAPRPSGQTALEPLEPLGLRLCQGIHGPRLRLGPERCLGPKEKSPKVCL